MDTTLQELRIAIRREYRIILSPDACAFWFTYCQLSQDQREGWGSARNNDPAIEFTYKSRVIQISSREICFRVRGSRLSTVDRLNTQPCRVYILRALVVAEGQITLTISGRAPLSPLYC